MAVLNLAYFQNAFKNFGKLIAAANYAATDSAAYDQLATGVVAQAISGLTANQLTEYNDYFQVVNPFAQAVNNTINSLNAIATAAQTACNNYLTKVIAVDLGLPANSSVAAAATAFMTHASTAEAWVQASGSNTTANSFAVWFKSIYSVTLCQDDDSVVTLAWSGSPGNYDIPGIYQDTDTLSNGLPIYTRLDGVYSIWLEALAGSQWRWSVTTTANIGIANNPLYITNTINTSFNIPPSGSVPGTLNAWGSHSGGSVPNGTATSSVVSEPSIQDAWITAAVQAHS